MRRKKGRRKKSKRRRKRRRKERRRRRKDEKGGGRRKRRRKIREGKKKINFWPLHLSSKISVSWVRKQKKQSKIHSESKFWEQP